MVAARRARRRARSRCRPPARTRAPAGRAAAWPASRAAARPPRRGTACRRAPARTAPCAAHGAGEGALLVAEQLALDEPRRDRRAVHLDEQALAPRAGSWMARATSSLPVPVSPVMRTFVLVAATRATRSMTRRGPDRARRPRRRVAAAQLLAQVVAIGGQLLLVPLALGDVLGEDRGAGRRGVDADVVPAAVVGGATSTATGRCSRTARSNACLNAPPWSGGRATRRQADELLARRPIMAMARSLT